MAEAFIGVIGGSGLYDIGGFHDRTEVALSTPFGPPSDAVITGVLEGTRLAFLPRHGRGHRFSPSEIPYRANIYALKQLGVDRVLSVSAVGSMKESIRPGTLVVADQFIDRTVGRPRTFFEDGVVGHVPMGDPVSLPLSAILYEAARSQGFEVQRGGTYVCIEGPQFSTRAESVLYRSWGVDVIGMTNMPEARLAREAELPYATLALVTDYDCWHSTEEDVTVEAVLAVLAESVQKAKDTIRAFAAATTQSPELECDTRQALQFAIMTDPSKVPAATRARLALLLDKYWK